MNEVRPNGATPSGPSGDRPLLAVLERVDARLARLEAVAQRVESLERSAATDTFDGLTRREPVE